MEHVMLDETAQEIFNRLEFQRWEILSAFDQLNAEQLRFKPAPDKWNLLQVLSHLVAAEKQSLAYIKRKLKYHEQLPKAGPGAYIRNKILQAALWLPVKFKAPRIAEVKEDDPDYDAMKSEWDNIRTEILSLIEENDSDILAKVLYKHPRAGKMNIRQALKFFESHISHHQKQVERIKNAPAFPPKD